MIIFFCIAKKIKRATAWCWLMLKSSRQMNFCNKEYVCFIRWKDINIKTSFLFLYYNRSMICWGKTLHRCIGNSCSSYMSAIIFKNVKEYITCTKAFTRSYNVIPFTRSYYVISFARPYCRSISNINSCTLPQKSQQLYINSYLILIQFFKCVEY